MSDFVMIKVEYVGKGAFFHGVPARDLSADEWAAMTSEQQKLIKESDVYKVLPKAKKVATSPTDPQEEAKIDGGEG